MYAHVRESAFCARCSERYRAPVSQHYTVQRKIYDMQVLRKQQVQAQHAYYQALNPSDKEVYDAYERMPLAQMLQHGPPAAPGAGAAASRSGAGRHVQWEACAQVAERMGKACSAGELLQNMAWLQRALSDADASRELQDCDPAAIDGAATTLDSVVAVLLAHVGQASVEAAGMRVMGTVCGLLRDGDDAQLQLRTAEEGTGLVLRILRDSQYRDRATCRQGLCILLTLTADCARNRPRSRLHARLLEGVLLAMQHCSADAACLLHGCRLIQRIYSLDDSAATMLRIEAQAVPLLCDFCATPAATQEMKRLTEEISFYCIAPYDM